MPSRMDRVNQQIKKEIGAIIQRELSDNRLQFVSITNVETSKDLRHARVYYSFLGGSDQSKNINDALNHASGLIRHYVGKRVNLRNTPELMFVFDGSIASGAKIEKTLKEIDYEEGHSDIKAE